MEIGLSDYIVLAIGWIAIGYAFYCLFDKIGLVDFIKDRFA